LTGFVMPRLMKKAKGAPRTTVMIPIAIATLDKARALVWVAIWRASALPVDN
jgi:hypothetical protein